MIAINTKQNITQNIISNSTTHNSEEKKINNLKREVTELYLEKENTYIGTEKEKIPA